VFVFVCSCGGWWWSRDAVDDNNAELELRHVLVVVHAAELPVEDDEAVLGHLLEVQSECHPCINFLFYFLKKKSIKINNKKLKKKHFLERAVKASERA